MSKQLVFAVLALFLVNNLEGSEIEKSAPLSNSDGTIIASATTGPVYHNIFEMIQGRVAGVWITGNFNNYRIRVRASLAPPLVVVDGFPFRNYNDRDINDLLATILPAEVDYIRVLKNVAQTMIYGPCGRNGVIVVRTKTVETKEM